MRRLGPRPRLETQRCLLRKVQQRAGQRHQSFDDGGSHYEWCTDIIGQNGELAWSIGELPLIEEVNEKVSIIEHCPEMGTVYLAEPDEVFTLVVEAIRRGEIGQTKE